MLYANLFNANFILLQNSRTPVDQYMRMRIGTRAHPG